MPEHLLDDLHVRAGSDGQARRGVAQLVRVLVRPPDRGGRDGPRLRAAHDDLDEPQRVAVPRSRPCAAGSRPARS